MRTGAVVERKIALGTADLSVGPAMTRDQAQRAVEAGIARQLAVREVDADGLRSFAARAGRVRQRWLG